MKRYVVFVYILDVFHYLYACLCYGAFVYVISCKCGVSAVFSQFSPVAYILYYVNFTYDCKIVVHTFNTFEVSKTNTFLLFTKEKLIGHSFSRVSLLTQGSAANRFGLHPFDSCVWTCVKLLKNH
jgi:hypothetical protein